MRVGYGNLRCVLNILFHIVVILSCLGGIEAKTVCKKYKSLPKSEWSSLRRECQEYLKIYYRKFEARPDTVVPTIASAPEIPTSKIVEPPANIGEGEYEREFEKEVEIEGSNGKWKDVEVDIEVEREVDSSNVVECSGNDCTKGSHDGRGRKGKGSAAGSGDSSDHEFLRTVAVLGMTAIAGVTIIVLAIAIFCVIKKRNQSAPEDERKDHQRQEKPSRGYTERPRESLPTIRSDRSDRSDRTRSTYRETAPTSGGSGPRPPMSTSTISTSNDADYSLVVSDSEYASIDESVSGSERTGPLSSVGGGHYYFKLDKDGNRKYQESVPSSRGSSRARLPPATSHGSASGGHLTSSTASISTSGWTSSQYDHLDHSSGKSRTPSEATSGSARYGVLSRT